jgi:hypothetical protein
MGEAAMIAGGLALAAALAMPDLRRVRIGALVAGLLALAGAAASGLWGVAGFALLVALVAGAPLAMAALPRARPRFTGVEAAFRARHLHGLDAGATRALLDQGHWLNARAGETLIREGQAVAGFFYLAEGEATALRGRQPVGRIGPGELIGEAGVLDDAPATATVTLRDYVDCHEPVEQALRRSFGMALREKLEEGNRTLAGRVS